MSAKGFALPVLYFLHHPRSSRKLPQPYHGLPTSCSGHDFQTLGRAQSTITVAHAAECWRDAGSPQGLPPGPIGMTCSMKMHAEYKKAASQLDDMQGNIGEILCKV